jgi:hypothetical protein
MIVAVELMDDQTGQKLLNVMYGGLSPHSRPNSLFCCDETYNIQHSKASWAAELAPGVWESFLVQKGSNLS